MNLPDIWGQGSIFAFSGLDGENTYENSLTGTLLGDQIGVLFHTRVRRKIFFELNGNRDIQYQLVASDLIKLDLVSKENETRIPLVITFSSQDTVTGITSRHARPCVWCEGTESGQDRPETEKRTGKSGNCTVHATEGEVTAFGSQKCGDLIRFSFSCSRKSADDALQKMRQGLSADLDSLLSDRLSFYRTLPIPGGISAVEEKMLRKCFSVMKSQVYSPEGLFRTRWTTPDRVPHKMLWLWDSVFHSLGNRYLSEALAYETLSAVLATQRQDGFVPIMSAPGWSHEDETQPPILAWGLLDLYRFSGQTACLEETYGALKKYLQWNMKNRDSNQNGLFEWKIRKNDPNCRCGECGMDNSPRFDAVVELDCVDFSCYMANEMRCMAEIASTLGLKQESHAWAGLYRTLRQAVNTHLWDDDDLFYYDREISTGKLRKVKAISSFLPLFAGICDDAKAKSLVRHLVNGRLFQTSVPVPSVSLDDPSFGTDMWRGPVWLNFNHLIILGLREYGYADLADQIKQRSLEALAAWYLNDGVLYEFYDSENRISPSRLNRKGSNIQPWDPGVRMQCIRDYVWTSAIAAAWLMERQPGKKTIKQQTD